MKLISTRDFIYQVAEISRSRDIAHARKSFKKLLKDTKNRDFVDKIYLEIGVFERKQGNIDEAIENFELAIRKETTSKLMVKLI